MTPLEAEMRLDNFLAEIADDGAKAGGILYCYKCGEERPLGDSGAVADYYANGWPKHCGQTMSWITQRQIDEGTS